MSHRTSLRPIVIGLAALALLVAACGSSTPISSPTPVPATPLPRPSGAPASGPYIALQISGDMTLAVSAGSVTCTTPWFVLDASGKQTAAGGAEANPVPIPSGAVRGIAYSLRSTDYPGKGSFELVTVISDVKNVGSPRVVLTSSGTIYQAAAASGSITLLPDGNGVAFHGLNLSTAPTGNKQITLNGQAACK